MPRLRASFQIHAVGSQNLAILIQLIIEPVLDLVSQFENIPDRSICYSHCLCPCFDRLLHRFCKGIEFRNCLPGFADLNSVTAVLPDAILCFVREIIDDRQIHRRLVDLLHGLYEGAFGFGIVCENRRESSK